MNDPFVEKIARTRNTTMEKVSGVIFETRIHGHYFIEFCEIYCVVSLLLLVKL